MNLKRNSQILILGIGNILMGDEGIGVHLIRHMEERPMPYGVTLLDGGTGSFQLLGPIQQASHVILVDAALDGKPAGTITRLQPRYSSDYPPSLTAHDIGLKDLLDTLYLGHKIPKVVLFSVSIGSLQDVELELSDSTRMVLPELARRVLREARDLRSSEMSS